MSMIQDPWAECTKKTETVFASEPTEDDLVHGEPKADAAVATADASSDDDDNDADTDDVD